MEQDTKYKNGNNDKEINPTPPSFEEMPSHVEPQQSQYAASEQPTGDGLQAARTQQRISAMKNTMQSLLQKAKAFYYKRLRKYISPAFFIMLFLSFVMWYIIKLGYTYTASIPVLVNIEGHELRVMAVAEGEGYNLFANRHYKQRNIHLNWSDLEVSPSATNPDAVVISPLSLQNAISVKKSDIKIISLGPIPEVEL